jgi:hypothetical protein
MRCSPGRGIYGTEISVNISIMKSGCMIEVAFAASRTRKVLRLGATRTWQSDTATELTRFDRILLHLRCLCHDRKYRWHLAGVWREMRLR